MGHRALYNDRYDYDNGQTRGQEQLSRHGMKDTGLQNADPYFYLYMTIAPKILQRLTLSASASITIAYVLLELSMVLPQILFRVSKPTAHQPFVYLQQSVFRLSAP